MAAMLEKNSPDGKPTLLPTGLTHSEVVKCEFCNISYTLAYGAVENRIEQGHNVLDSMRQKAKELISEAHPHAVDIYIWGGFERGWFDREQAKAAGL
jgi:hypothetical protein